jgi:hypothetical protein
MRWYWEFNDNKMTKNVQRPVLKADDLSSNPAGV